VDRLLSEHGWPMTIVNAVVGAGVVGAVAVLMYLDTRM
jgi:hypothetical protein